MHNSVICRRASLLEADLGYELVALSETDGLCLGFNETAAAVWKLLERPATFEVLCQAIAARFDVAGSYCELRLGELVVDMERRGLIEVRDHQPSPAANHERILDAAAKSSL